MVLEDVTELYALLHDQSTNVASTDAREQRLQRLKFEDTENAAQW